MGFPKQEHQTGLPFLSSIQRVTQNKRNGSPRVPVEASHGKPKFLLQAHFHGFNFLTLCSHLALSIVNLILPASLLIVVTFLPIHGLCLNPPRSTSALCCRQNREMGFQVPRRWEKTASKAPAKKLDLKKGSTRTSLVVQWLRLHTLNAGAQVPSLGQELDPPCPQ